MSAAMIDVARHPAPVPTPQVRRRFDELLISRWLGASTRVIAEPTRVHAQRWPFLVLYVMVGPVRVEQTSTPTDLRAGEIVLLSNTEELRIECAENAALLLVNVPIGAVGPYGHALESAVGRVFDTREGTPHLVARMLDGLAADLDVIAPMHPGQLARHLVGFVALACEDGHVDGRSRDPNIGRAKEYIELNLRDFELGPNQVARCLNVSIRTLHRAFERESLSVAGWIRWRRLEHCRSELADRGFDHDSVSVIGARWGFWDAAHFSKLFKTQYAASPRAYRAQSARQDIANAASA
ncbi:hypothetical protein ASE12_14240 [Aeromicrobium sp. Root236]|uniref:helix-turn-helix domain-containing protein n=1 Tax=Aeromicrobium sp. Root236 TaxID=1736498 RepID=UPI0006F713D0|nr:helix-turn-helix domain-containing protein [Aeromicrobium sp. Root236]KRC65815.1 hypothetical protein ASE12_14240 [Aeromicrobium sp. Root236]